LRSYDSTYNSSAVLHDAIVAETVATTVAETVARENGRNDDFTAHSF